MAPLMVCGFTTFSIPIYCKGLFPHLTKIAPSDSNESKTYV
uniref:Uncharacterized protein n=1 Tax=Arundo donax TaxID=35708 RepID=A0A0A9A641_ARUDO